MRFIEDLCPPALLYLIFLVVQLGLDASLGMWVTFSIKVILGFATVMVLDTFCGIGLSVVSWFLVATPFLITALGTAIAIGTQFDAKILGQLKETFVDKSAHENDLPEQSNSVSRQAGKTDSKGKKE
jgi:Na+(H+)/acetate symporter ActP